MLFLSTALVSIGPIESYDSTSYVKWGEGDEAAAALANLIKPMPAAKKSMFHA